MTWAVKPGASLADLATIELRRVTDVLQVDHASLFLRDEDDPQRTIAVAETGLPAGEALPEHRVLLGRVLRTARAAEVQSPEGETETCCAALATPLLHEDRAVGALLVVTRRANRRLGAIDAEVVERATQTLVERFLAPSDRHESRREAERFVRDARVGRR
jgi:GAF domain